MLRIPVQPSVLKSTSTLMLATSELHEPYSPALMYSTETK